MAVAGIYRVEIHGQVLESRSLKLLLSRAVAEKRSMDARFRMLLRTGAGWRQGVPGNRIEDCRGDLSGLNTVLQGAGPEDDPQSAQIRGRSGSLVSNPGQGLSWEGASP